MTGEITRRSVLLECLQIMREELNICSSKYNGLEPKKGMEEAWAQCRKKVSVLEDLTQAMDSEPAPALDESEASMNPKAAALLDLLNRCHGNREKAAAELGISKTTLWRRMKKYGIDRDLTVT